LVRLTLVPAQVHISVINFFRFGLIHDPSTAFVLYSRNSFLEIDIMALQSSLLGRLPPELIHYLAEFLPLASAATFTICCRPMKIILWNVYLEALQENVVAQYKFIALLELVGPDHIARVCCTRLHTMHDSTGPTCPEADWPGLYIHEDFSSTIFQMAMKRYRQGREYKNFSSPCRGRPKPGHRG
jgi:hypothetical protein